MTSETPALGKSGLKVLQPGEILFNDGELADSLFIIQKGQIRLFKPKGKGFVELVVLRAGEVIGEMAFFDQDPNGKKRSCSASAITAVEIIEISFMAFDKTMQSLNPWFKTIITTLAARLRKTNSRVKELEHNQASLNYGRKHTSYEFMKPIEVMRVLGTLFLVFKAHGELRQQAFAISRKTLNLYAHDMYQIKEVRLESIINLLIQFGWMEVENDDDQLPNLLLLKNIDIIRQIFIYYNGERHLSEEKKMKIGDKCEMLLAKMLDNGTTLMLDIPNLKVIDDVPPRFTKYYNISPILEEFKAKAITIHPEHLIDGKEFGLFGDIFMKDGLVLVETDFAKIQRLYPVIRFLSAIKKSNAEKGGEN